MGDEIKQLLDWYKSEYKLAYGRYENIYRSVWTIISFLGALAGAVFAFGAARIGRQVRSAYR